MQRRNNKLEIIRITNGPDKKKSGPFLLLCGMAVRRAEQDGQLSNSAKELMLAELDGHSGYNPPINAGTQGSEIFDRFVYEQNAY